MTTICLRDKVHEAGQRLIGLIPHVAKLNHHLFLQLVVDDGHGEGGSLIRQEAAIVGALQVELQICRQQLDNSLKTCSSLF